MSGCGALNYVMVSRDILNATGAVVFFFRRLRPRPLGPRTRANSEKLIFRLQASEATFQNLIATSSKRETLVPMTDKRLFARTRRMEHLGGARLQGVATVKILGSRRGHLRTFGVFFFSKTQ